MSIAGVNRPQEVILLAAFALIAALAALDLTMDVREGARWLHVTAEAVVLVVAIAGIWAVLDHLRRETARAREHAALMRGSLERTRNDAAHWQREAESLMRGLGAKIGEQFGRWGLTVAEREVALLLLKGLSHREIAVLRGISDTTARQQATAVYQKAGVSGRVELAAFFLEDLALPPAA